MNRVIKFRGKRCKDGEWVYGSYVESNTSWNGHKPHKSWILPSPMTNGGWFSIRGAYPVIEDTVGQFTGLVDKNGKEIYEGDVVSWYALEYQDRDLFEEPSSFIVKQEEEVVFDCGGFSVKHDTEFPLKYLTEDYRITNPVSTIFEYTYNKDEYPFIKNENDLCFCEIIGNIFDNPELLKGGDND